MGPGRQVFFCSMDGFDTHSSQDWTHWNLLSQLSQAMGAFDTATQEMSLSQQITTFTQSEFGRTMQSNGSGSDHAWGSHQMVLGGAVRGGIYGQMPTFAFCGPGRCEQSRRVDSDDLHRAVRRDARQMVRRRSAGDLAWAFPTLPQFASRAISGSCVGQDGAGGCWALLSLPALTCPSGPSGPSRPTPSRWRPCGPRDGA